MPGIALENNVEGAFYTFASIQGLVDNSNGKIQNGWDFAEILLESEGVAVVPGEAFGADNHFRVSFATSTEVRAEPTDYNDRLRGTGTFRLFIMHSQCDPRIVLSSILVLQRAHHHHQQLSGPSRSADENRPSMSENSIIRMNLPVSPRYWQRGGNCCTLWNGRLACPTYDDSHSLLLFSSLFFLPRLLSSSPHIIVVATAKRAYVEISGVEGYVC